jgi:hypothetical protein
MKESMLQVNQWLTRKERRGEGLAGERLGGNDDDASADSNDDANDGEKRKFPLTDDTAELLKLPSMLAGLDAEPLESLAAGAITVHLAANQVRGVQVCSASCAALCRRQVAHSYLQLRS